MNKLIGKTAIITGASSGIGAKIAEQFASEGANVVLAARRKEKLTMVAEAINAKGNGQALAVVTDVSNRADVEDMVKQARNAFGVVDIYVNNAGLMLESVVKEGNVEAWESMIDVNIKGVLYGINAVLPGMVERETGHIVNISSVSGQEVTKTSTVYSATKFAARALSMGLEKELARTGVRVTNVSPGMVDTDLIADNKLKDRKPLNTDDIANAIVYAVTQPEHVNVNEITVRPV
ncbi:NADP-dependent 3-hydroxy acid dehydrogenase YdfG [Virgibacillus halotolerans]|uniref:SDR family oxidoreductase n=1 Tax=Virgibacillus halotolerans TaxID=1071053 RepID=UPI00195F5656|nr:SDR family oxidoreductase [Virgibacillus halotolerans]MBM7598797.1 NADP-dependent 3-hydroxy acid dehydrogenase YdfG [Virgibacillus halotolerans]